MTDTTNSSKCDVDIIIITWNTKEMTCECVKSAQTAIETEKINASIWIVDNNSSDGTVAELQKRFSGINIIANDSNAGFSIANNIAIRQSTAPYVLLLNSDAFLHANCLTILLTLLQQEVSIGAIGPKLILKSGVIQQSVANITSPLSQLGYLLAFHFPPFDQWLRPFFSRNREALVVGEHTREVPLLSAACLLVRRSVFERVGLLPEDRFLYSEEDDLFFRMRKAGIRSLYAPSAQATHLLGATTTGTRHIVSVNEHFFRSRLRFLFTHYPRLKLATYAMHLIFLGWCKTIGEIKFLLRKRESDSGYVHGCKIILKITKDEYLRA